MMRRWLAALLLGAAGLAGAHDFHVGITDISYNERTRQTEIVHTYVLHDLMQLFATQLGEAAPEPDTPAGERLVRAYLEKRFAIEKRDGNPLPLRWVGVEAGQQNLVIYQELPGRLPASGLFIRQGVLAEAFPGQSNTVNLRQDGKTKSLLFEGGLLRQPLR